MRSSRRRLQEGVRSLLRAAIASGARRPLARRWFVRLAGFFTPTVETAGPGGRFLVDPTDLIGRTLWLSGEWDGWAVALVARHLARLGYPDRSGATFVDVGANLGTAVVAALVQQGFGRGVAIEPEPMNVRLLRYNLALNGIDDRVVVVPAAASDHAGAVRLRLNSSRNRGDHRVAAAAADANGDSQILPVPAVTLDGLVAGGTIDPDQVGVLWIDVQGHETHVLRGASRLLARGVPTVLEYWPSELARSGTLDELDSLIARHYTRIVVLGMGKEVSADNVQRLRGWCATDDAHIDVLLLNR